jgi:pimeloyl-ACP methyl ester carboxylesterase
MAKVLLVHGAFNEFWGPHELKARWLPALRDGLWHHEVAIEDDDVAVCFYGDLFRHDPEQDDLDAFERSRAGVAEMLSKLDSGGTLEAVSQAVSDAAFDRTVDMVTTMMTTPDLRDQVRARIDDALVSDTRVVVSHSLGTVVSYQALCRHAASGVRTLVTLGSPLGSPMMAAQLDPPPVDGKGAWPGSVQRWVNVAAVGDRVATPARLADHFAGSVEDHLIDNGHRAHDPEPYLNSHVVGRAVADALHA